VEILLKHATDDELSNDVKQNAAICLAKLATADKRYCNTTHNHCFSVKVYMTNIFSLAQWNLHEIVMWKYFSLHFSSLQM